MYLNLTQAAEYCGYSSSRFSELLRDYPLPKYGPSRNRYFQPDLDAWMRDPGQFKAKPRKRGRKVLSMADTL